MPTVPLKRSINSLGSFVHAPDFCTYAEPEMSFNVTSVTGGVQAPCMHPTGKRIVDASICNLCKVCTFVSEVRGAPATEPTPAEREAFLRFLTVENREISSSILGQRQYLAKSERLPIMVIVSAELLDLLLRSTVPEDARRQRLQAYFVTGGPLCDVLGCPVYFSLRLTKALVQVVGEVEWK
jgi:hypothetical protein